MLEEITLTDITFFLFGFAVGIGINYLVGKLVFNRLFKKEADNITVKATASYEMIQHVISYVFGFIMGSTVISPELLATVFAAWLAFQTILAQKVFGFNTPLHGFTFAGIDTLGDIAIGKVFGSSAASLSFTLVRMALQ